MAREKWSDIVALYKTYLSVIEPNIKETALIIREMDPEDILDHEKMIETLEKETKRKVRKVKVLAEFNAFLKKELFKYILEYADDVKDELEPLEIQDYILDYLDEALQVLYVLQDMVPNFQNDGSNGLLDHLVQFLAKILLPSGKSLQDIYDKLLDEPKWYEIQRYILKTTTHYREKLDGMEIPGISPKLYQIINNMTSIFNLEPNFLDMPGDENTVIPGIMKEDVFESYVKNLANNEEAALKRIIKNMEMQLIHGMFIAPTTRFLKLAEPHNYVSTQQDDDGKVRYLPQFSNETLILLYLAQVSFRRGFLSKELINWISANFAFLIYNSVLYSTLSEDNIFYNLFLDLKTEEKVLPYLMKLICFENHLRLDRNKIRDSPTYRKELFNFLGSKIEALSDLTWVLSDEVKRILKKT